MLTKDVGVLRKQVADAEAAAASVKKQAAAGGNSRTAATYESNYMN